MDCPGCNVEMADLEGDETTLRKCGECGGLWIDVADLNRVLLHNNLPGLESLGGTRRRRRRSPASAPSARWTWCAWTAGIGSHPLHYDTCESCGGIFLESEFKDATDAKVAVAGDRRLLPALLGAKKKSAASR